MPDGDQDRALIDITECCAGAKAATNILEGVETVRAAESSQSFDPSVMLSRFQAQSEGVLRTRRLTILDADRIH